MEISVTLVKKVLLGVTERQETGGTEDIFCYSRFNQLRVHCGTGGGSVCTCLLGWREEGCSVRVSSLILSVEM